MVGIESIQRMHWKKCIHKKNTLLRTNWEFPLIPSGWENLSCYISTTVLPNSHSSLSNPSSISGMTALKGCRLLPPHTPLLSVTFCKLILSEEELRLPHLQIVHTQVAAAGACHTTIPEMSMGSCTSPALSILTEPNDDLHWCDFKVYYMWSLKFAGCEPNLKEQLLKYIFLSTKMAIWFWIWKINLVFKKKLIKNAFLTINDIKRYANKP